MTAVVVIGISADARAANAPSRVRPRSSPSPRRVGGVGRETLPRPAGRIPVRSSTIIGSDLAAVALPGDRPPPSRSRSKATRGATPLAPVSTSGFDALSGSRHHPADPTGALGDTNVVTAVNTKVAVYDRNGTVVHDAVSLARLAAGIEGQKFDPKIVYDQYRQTFVLVFLIRDARAKRSRIIVTTIPDNTASNDATWCTTIMRGDAVSKNGRQWADYPGLGYDANSVTISTNAFNFGGGLAYAQLYHIADTELFAPCDPADRVRFHVFAGDETRDPDGSKGFTIQPAQTVGASTVQHLLSYDTSGFVVVWRIRDGSKAPWLSRSAIKVRRAQVAPFGTQRGGGYRDDDTWWDPGDLRLVNAFYDTALNRIYAAHAILRDLKPDPIVPYVEAAVRWYEVRPTRRLGSSTITRTGIVGRSETDAGWPVLATDAGGNLFVAYNRASKPRGEYLSAWVAEIAPGAAAASSTLLGAGESRFEAIDNRPERWGDFNAINRDATDGSVVAVVNQYARDDGKAPAGVTKTWQQTFDLVSDG